MTTSEIVRLVIVIILIVIVIARRQGLLQKWREDRKKKERAAARKLLREEKKATRKAEQERQDQKKVQTAQILKRSLRDLEQRSIGVAGQEIFFLDAAARPDAETVLLLHGFAGDKENWSEIGEALLSRGYRPVAPDLPGFGQNEKDPDSSYEVTAQAKRIRALTQRLGLERFHLVGHSVGGSIAAALAYASADHVSSLTMVEPFGVRVPYESELDQLLAKDRNPLFIASPAAYDNLLGFVCRTPPEVPADLKRLRAEREARHRSHYLKVWQEVCEGERAHLLDLLLPEIRVRTLVLQGAQSRVVHPATAEMIAAMMKNAQAVVLEGCGHFPMVECPEETAEHLLEFLGTGPAT